jgi:hypothetical protein
MVVRPSTIASKGSPWQVTVCSWTDRRSPLCDSPVSSPHSEVENSAITPLLAVEAAFCQSMRTLGLLGKGGGALRAMVDIAMVLSSSNTQRNQEIHITIRRPNPVGFVPLSANPFMTRNISKRGMAGSTVFSHPNFTRFKTEIPVAEIRKDVRMTCRCGKVLPTVSIERSAC